MGVSFLLTLREGLEISLVLAVLFGYLAKTGRRDMFGAAWTGVAAATAVCVVTGLAFKAMVGDFTGKPEQLIEGTLAFTAAGVLTWMIFWMRRNARGISGELRSRIDDALTGSATALTVVAFVAVAREGFETVLFLIGAESEGASGADVVVGGLLGLSVAAVLGVLIYRGGHRIDLAKFFTWTGALLLLFAAGLFAKGVHEFREFFEIDWSVVADPAWVITSGPLAAGRQLHNFLAGLFGWSPEPERIRVVAYFAYLIPVLTLWRRPPVEAQADAAPADLEPQTVGKGQPAASSR